MTSPVRDLSAAPRAVRSEEHTSELQSQFHLVCRLLLEKKNRLPRATSTYSVFLIPPAPSFFLSAPVQLPTRSLRLPLHGLLARAIILCSAVVRQYELSP